MSAKKAKNKKVLGRGLGNLLDSSSTAKAARSALGIEDIELSKIRTNPDNPRKKFNKSAIDELAQTIAQHGLLQPILVVQEDKHYRVISGERRLRACRSLNQKKIPCIVKTVTNHEIHEISLIENIQREQLDAIEEAQAFKVIIDNNSLTQEELAEKIGKSRSAIANRIRLLQLPLNVQTAIADGRLTEGQVRPILTIKDEKQQNKIINQILREDLSARQIEDLVKKVRGDRPAVTNKKKKRSADITALEKKLEEKLNLRVRIDHNEKKQSGKLTLEYFSLDEFDKLVKTLGIRK